MACNRHDLLDWAQDGAFPDNKGPHRRSLNAQHDVVPFHQHFYSQPMILSKRGGKTILITELKKFILKDFALAKIHNPVLVGCNTLNGR